MERTYFCIDMKTFYASVECAERNLNPFETNLVVADVTRGKNALCLAVSPKMKAQGIKNRCRLSEIPNHINYIIAPPQMALYIEYAADIYEIYLEYFSPDDIYVYSIDESFIDVTSYIEAYDMLPADFALKIMNDIANRLHIPSTCGIGSNLFLCKIALDITAKHSRNHIGVLDEEIFYRTLWNHKPITDFWMIAQGTASRLAKYGIYTMRDITNAPTELLYRLFGINAELLIDHAWGREPCIISDIKAYKAKSKSVSFSQILPRNYTYDEARVVMREMTDHACMELMRRHSIAGGVYIGVGYSYGTREFESASSRFGYSTSLPSKIVPASLEIFDSIADKNTPIRRLAISFSGVCDESCEGYDFFTDWEEIEKEKSREKTVLGLMSRYGKNAVLKGNNYLKSATQRERNCMIGGHRAGNDDKS